MKSKRYACIDIGGTAIKYGIADENRTLLCKNETETNAHLGGPALFEKAASIVEELQKIETIDAICISTAGMVDWQKGEIVYASSAIPDYAGVNYIKGMEKRFSLPCSVENDVNCAGLAEAAFGSAKDARNALILTIGTGIGGCFVQEGCVYHGSSFAACEVGYLPLEDSDFQTLASTTALVQDMAARKNEPVSAWNGRRIFEAYKNGDPDAKEAVDLLCLRLGKGIAAVCTVLNPDMIVLGGGIAAQHEILKERILASLQTHLPSRIFESLELRFASSGNDAGMLGALVHFQNTKEKP